MTDARVVGLFVYRLKNIWQTTDMSQLDACQNPWGTGLGLVDRCGVGGSGGYATPKTLALYRQNNYLEGTDVHQDRRRIALIAVIAAP